MSLATHVSTDQDAILVSPVYYRWFNFPTVSLILHERIDSSRQDVFKVCQHALKHMQDVQAGSRNQLVDLNSEVRVMFSRAGGPGESVMEVNLIRWWWAVVLSWVDEGLCLPPYPLPPLPTLLLLLAAYLLLDWYRSSLVSVSLLR